MQRGDLVLLDVKYCYVYAKADIDSQRLILIKKSETALLLSNPKCVSNGGVWIHTLIYGVTGWLIVANEQIEVL